VCVCVCCVFCCTDELKPATLKSPRGAGHRRQRANIILSVCVCVCVSFMRTLFEEARDLRSRSIGVVLASAAARV